MRRVALVAQARVSDPAPCAAAFRASEARPAQCGPTLRVDAKSCAAAGRSDGGRLDDFRSHRGARASNSIGRTDGPSYPGGPGPIERLFSAPGPSESIFFFYHNDVKLCNKSGYCLRNDSGA